MAGLIADDWQADATIDTCAERPDGRWAATEVAIWVSRQNGKGGLIEIRVLAGLFLFGEKMIMWSAHEYKTAQEGFLRIKGLIQETPELDRLVNRYWQANGEQGIELTTGQRLRFLARSRGSGRGFSGDTNILDEAQYLTLPQVAAIYPTMSARKNPQILYYGTPPEDQTAFVYGIKADGERGKPRMVYLDFGAKIDLELPPAELQEIVSDKQLWYRHNPAMPIRITEEFVEDELSRLGPLKFAMERLGAWLPPLDEDEQWLVITQEQWKAIADPQDPENPENTGSKALDPVAYCVDVTPDRSSSAIGAAGWRSDDLAHIEVVDERPGTSWVVDRMVELEKHEPCVVVIDPTGPAKSLIPDLEKKGITVKQMTAADVSDAYGQFYDDCTDSKSIRHLSQPDLNRGVAGAETRDIGDGRKAWGRRSSAVSIAGLVAVTNALWGLKEAGAVISGDLMA